MNCAAIRHRLKSSPANCGGLIEAAWVESEPALKLLIFPRELRGPH